MILAASLMMFLFWMVWQVQNMRVFTPVDDVKQFPPLIALGKAENSTLQGVIQQPSSGISTISTSNNAITKSTKLQPEKKFEKKKNRKKRRQRSYRPAWQNCSLVMDGVELIEVANTTNSTTERQKIYCFIMTHSNRQRNVKAVFDTWGSKCDYLLIASNVSDPELNAVEMKTEPTYQNLWKKLNETIHYISSTTNGFQDYDWYFKLDDDSFVIMENLHAFLESPEVQEKKRQKLPLVYGRRFAWPPYWKLGTNVWGSNFFGHTNEANRAFGSRFFQKVNSSSTLVYPSGGAGYIMNQQFVSTFLETFDSDDTLHGIPDEDMAVAINMLYQGITPQPSHDSQGRQLFHPELPRVMYNLPNITADWLIDNHKVIGGIKKGPDCCSPFSISFHHAVPGVLRHLQYRVYDCNKRDEQGRGDV
jgi:glycoprotein-N-acetylgalactosamine 3-beta-galactosyltransferase